MGSPRVSFPWVLTGFILSERFLAPRCATLNVLQPMVRRWLLLVKSFTNNSHRRTIGCSTLSGDITLPNGTSLLVCYPVTLSFLLLGPLFTLLTCPILSTDARIAYGMPHLGHPLGNLEVGKSPCSYSPGGSADLFAFMDSFRQGPTHESPPASATANRTISLFFLFWDFMKEPGV